MNNKIINIAPGKEIVIADNHNGTINLCLVNRGANFMSNLDVTYDQAFDLAVDIMAFSYKLRQERETKKIPVYELCRAFSRELTNEPVEVILANTDETLLDDMAAFLNLRDEFFMYFVRPRL